MAASTLDQVIASLQNVYQPQIDSINQQQAALPAQAAAQTAGVNAAKDDAFNGILSQARQRGTGVAFGGIPLGEQAQYTASTYAPALANLQTSQNQQGQSLVDALNKINEDKFNTANGIYQFGVNQDNQAQQLAEQQREFDASQAAAAKAAASANSFSPSSGGGAAPTSGANPAAALTGGKTKQDAQNAITALMNTGNGNTIANTVNAILKSASYGNTYDQAKIELLQHLGVIDSKGKLVTAKVNTNSGGLNLAGGGLLGSVGGLTF